MKASIRQLLTLSIVLILNGCANEMSKDQRFVMSPIIDNSHPRATLVTASHDIVDKIKLLNPIFKEVGRLTQAQVRVQSLAEERYTLEYKFAWEDAQGFTVGGNGVWQRFTLAGGQTQSFNSVGKTPDAKMIVFTVRLPDDTFIDLQKRQSAE